MPRRRKALLYAVSAMALVSGGCPTTTTTDESDLVYVKNSSTSSDVAGYIEGTEGNRLAVLADKNSAGEATRVTGAYFRSADGAEWTTFLGSDGLPSKLVVADFVFEFTNYASATVDVACTFPDGTRRTQSGVATNSEIMAFLRNARSASQSGPYSKLRSNIETSKEIAQSSTLEISKALRVAGAAISGANCVASLAVAAGITTGSAFLGTPVGVALTAVGCAGFVISTVNLAFDNETLSNVGTGAALVQCGVGAAVGQFSNCTSLLNNILLRATADFERARTSGGSGGGGGGGGGGTASDSDGDGVPDAQDGCPNDRNKTSPGNCGCGEPERQGCAPAVNSTEPDDSRELATRIAISPGTSVVLTGRSPCGDEDWFVVSASAGQRIRIDATGINRQLELLTHGANQNGDDVGLTGDFDQTPSQEILVARSGQIFIEIDWEQCRAGDEASYAIVVTLQ